MVRVVLDHQDQGRSIGKMSEDYESGVVGADGNILASENSGGTWTRQNGIIDTDTTWSASGSPYVVTGTVLVSERSEVDGGGRCGGEV